MEPQPEPDGGLDRLLRRARELAEPPPAGLIERIRAGLEARERAASRRRRRLAIVTGLAALVLVVAGVGRWLGPERPGPVMPLAEPSSPREAVPGAPPARIRFDDPEHPAIALPLSTGRREFTIYFVYPVSMQSLEGGRP